MSSHLPHARNIAEWTLTRSTRETIDILKHYETMISFFIARRYLTRAEWKCRRLNDTLWNEVLYQQRKYLLCVLRSVNTYGEVTEYLHEFLTSALGSNKQSISRPGLINPHGKSYWYWLDRKLVGHKASKDAAMGGGGGFLSTNRNRIHVPRSSLPQTKRTR
jgi:hypothetical protein